MANPGAEQEVQKPKVVFSTLTADGDWLFLKGKYKKAIESYTAALTLKPEDKSCFVGRAKCYLRVGQYVNALRDAEASLRDDPSFFEGLYQKAEALYCMGEFEFAAVFYHRGQKLRPQVQEFRLGVQKAQEAIENTVGNPSSVKLEIKGDLSFFQKDEEMTAPIMAVQRLTADEKHPTMATPKSKKTTKQRLGEFYSDKKYLEDLLKDQDLLKGKTRGGEKLQDVIQSCLTYLDTCTEFWNSGGPPHKREPKQKKCSKLRPSAPSKPAHVLLKTLDDIDADLTSGNAKGSLKKAEEVMKMVKGWTEKQVPNKKEVLGSLHSCMGNALMELGDLDRALQHHQKDLEIATQCKLPEATSRALDNMGRVYAQSGQFALAIQIWEEKIPLLRGALEKTWLFHEVGRCHLELGRLEEARGYGLRSVAASQETGDEKWKMNANVLVAQSEAKLGKFASSVCHFERALFHAKLLPDDSAAAAAAAIQKALDDTKQRLQH